jgi:hypothetical protein
MQHHRCRKLAGLLRDFAAPSASPKDIELVQRESQEIGDALEAHPRPLLKP